LCTFGAVFSVGQNFDDGHFGLYKAWA